jgi:hypothetical protein
VEEAVKTADLVEVLRDEQAKHCSYGTREGDGKTCDCKYANPLRPWNPEATGCPELRAAIWVLLDVQLPFPRIGAEAP